MSSDRNRLYEFGDFRIDMRKGLLLHRGVPVQVPPKAFETLIALVESDGRVVSKDELIAKVWGGMIVEENNLTPDLPPAQAPRRSRAIDDRNDSAARLPVRRGCTAGLRRRSCGPC